MQVVHTIAALRTALAAHPSCSFVPTMGNLHAGHVALVSAAAARHRPVVVSIFVNRLQFLPHEDFDRYPRTLAEDCAQLAQAGCDLVFAPAESELYPQPQSYTIQPPTILADCLEGRSRPGFFNGVCTVVSKLFACVQPTLAVFGQKDYQQLRVIQGLVQAFNWPIEILGIPTERDTDGLAWSSRNAYLSRTERAQAAQLYGQLQSLSQRVRDSSQTLNQLEQAACHELQARGWRPDYIAIRERSTLQAPHDADRASQPLVILGAAWLGTTRLIDNLEC